MRHCELHPVIIIASPLHLLSCSDDVTEHLLHDVDHGVVAAVDSLQVRRVGSPLHIILESVCIQSLQKKGDKKQMF